MGKPIPWNPEMEALGYKDPLLAPICVVQAMLASICDTEMHEYIQRKDKEAMADTDEEGEHAPLLLSTLDFSQWIAIMTTIMQDREKGMEMIKEAHLKLPHLLERDVIEY